MRKASAEVSVSRLLRLLRPLRVKCQQLRVLSTRTSYFTVLRNSGIPPLAGLPRTRTRYQSKEFVDICTKVHAVCDAFRNVLSAICRGGCPLSQSQIPSLAASSASVLGFNIESELNERLQDTDVLAELSAEEESEFVEQEYEAVPWQWRRWTFLSHALSIVLSTCPHYPALLISIHTLLMSYGLASHGHLAMRRLLVAAVQGETQIKSMQAIAPPICHDDHETFLSDLAIGEYSMSYRRLTTMLLDAQESHGVSSFWRSKTISRFVRKTSKVDSWCFTYLLSALAECIDRARPSFVLDGLVRHDPLIEDLQERLSRWMQLMIARLIQNLSHDLFEIALSFILRIDELIRLDTCSQNEGSIKLRNAYASLVVYHSSHYPLAKVNVQRLVNTLMKIQARATTFDILLRALIEAKPPRVMDKLLACSAWLRSLHMTTLEASLWEASLALFVPETKQSLDGPEDNLQLDYLQDEMRRRWKEAQDRCRAEAEVIDTERGRSISPLLGSSNRSAGFSDSIDGMQARKETGWIIDRATISLRRPERVPALGGVDSSPLSTGSVLGKRRHRPAEDGENLVEKENRGGLCIDISTSRSVSPHPGRRCSGSTPSASSTFRSILALSSQQRTVLHSPDRSSLTAGSRRLAPSSVSQIEYSSGVEAGTAGSYRSFGKSRREDASMEPSSDDVLDCLGHPRTPGPRAIASCRAPIQ